MSSVCDLCGVSPRVHTVNYLLMASLLSQSITPPMTVQEAVYIRSAINTYVRSIKASDEKDILLMWLRRLDEFLNTSAVVSNTDKPF